MKPIKSFRLLIMFMGFLVLMISCKKENTSSYVMTEEEAAEVISLSISGSTEGLVTQTAEIAARANTYGNVCGYSKDSTIISINTAGTYTWNYTFKWQWSVLCTGAVPNSMNANYTMKGMYGAPRISSSDSAIANLAVTNLISGSQYTFNGTYTRDGSQVSKIRNRSSLTSKVILGLINVKVNKNTGRIDAGTASVSIAGATTGGNSFTYGGTVTFMGNQSATISLNNGAVYNVSW
ncbi:MAG: hypothetical protein H7X88_04175 [Gloeobacteraceae cyanobacterium ES-bin-316]|nr:hypothetical protein [Ferruginibacter sp.]